MSLSYRRFTGLSNSSLIRTAEFQGKLQYVVPVVAMVGDSVVRSITAPGPEFVPSDVIARSAVEHSGRPVVGSHPKRGDEYVSANDPEIYERTCFGRIANSRYEKGKLVMDAWLDPDRAKEVGEEAISVVERAKAKEPIEVSIGVWVDIDKRDGVAPNGEKYTAIWSDVGSDHLAMLPEGDIGACSVSMGCGAPRVAKSRSGTDTNQPVLRAAKEDEVSGNGNGTNKPSVTQRLMESVSKLLGFRSAQDDGVSDVELRSALYKALRADEPGFDWVVEVFPDTNTVIYTTFPEDKVLYFRRTFSVSEDGTVTLNDDREQVEPKMMYEVVAASGNETEIQTPVVATGDCGCGGKKSTQPGQSAQGGSMNVQEKKDLIGRLIASTANPFTEADRGVLETFPDDRLKALETGFKSASDAGTGENPTGDHGVKTPPAAPSEPTPSPNPPTPNPPTKVVEIEASELETLRSLAAESTARKQKRHGELVTLLKSAQTVHNETSLKALSLERLEEMSALLKLEEPRADYSGARVAISSENIPELPDTYGLYKKSTQKEVSN